MRRPRRVGANRLKERKPREHRLKQRQLGNNRLTHHKRLHHSRTHQIPAHPRLRILHRVPLDPGTDKKTRCALLLLPLAYPRLRGTISRRKKTRCSSRMSNNARMKACVFTGTRFTKPLLKRYVPFLWPKGCSASSSANPHSIPNTRGRRGARDGINISRGTSQVRGG